MIKAYYNMCFAENGNILILDETKQICFHLDSNFENVSNIDKRSYSSMCLDIMGAFTDAFTSAFF